MGVTLKRNSAGFYYLKKTRDSIYKLFKDETYIRMQYKKKTGKTLNLEEPQTFNEKIQWLKLNLRNPLMTTCADKFLVRDYVEKKIGKDVLNDLYGVYKSVKDINIAELPDSFVMKVNHGSGQNIFCSNKNDFDFKKAVRELNRYLRYNHYLHGREWAYKNIEAQVIIEEYLNDSGKSPDDYKFFCFNGRPEFIQMDIDRFGNHTRNIYDLNWELMDFKIEYNNSQEEVPRPSQLNLMIDYAKKLSREFPFVRVDFYNFNNKIYFGEMTFYPGNGVELIYPEQYSTILGEKIRLNG
ncbi:teichuronopeptide biosynthesis TupA-like protein [Paenibacillus cellulosilyticus]|uniref:Teichuronopeptide biosynthesis TupA-like protein n=1 Tax=Paenibacillus cellulosilyticus TaxID=375489 RepID=A0A2V2Z001_9BACL|nr:ATP-grasp fold amidoligase family protein [Paenibacillus cellulosilyticus]PWW08475.1 teichuronopeptide biosynthesis TupA-like protein [Paenibacillus cellulosilyticus]QKS48060.1 glycosyltransferase [Paenibacillus cellulosilyticus]